MQYIVCPNYYFAININQPIQKFVFIFTLCTVKIKIKLLVLLRFIFLIKRSSTRSFFLNHSIFILCPNFTASPQLFFTIISPGGEKVNGQNTCKVDKADPRSRFHYVKYVKRHGRTLKLWECGICEYSILVSKLRHYQAHS